MHIIQMAQEQHAIYFRYAFFRHFRHIFQESLKCNYYINRILLFLSLLLINKNKYANSTTVDKQKKETN